MSVDDSRITKNMAFLGLARGLRSRPRRRLGREALARGHRLERQDRAPVPMLANFEMADQAVEFVMAKLDYSVVPEFHIDRFEFGIVIRRKGDADAIDPVNDPVSGGVSGGVSDLLNAIRGNPGKRVPELAELTGMSRRTIERYLKDRLLGYVEFRGAPKNGGYYVK